MQFSSGVNNIASNKLGNTSDHTMIHCILIFDLNNFFLTDGNFDDSILFHPNTK